MSRASAHLFNHVSPRSFKRNFVTFIFDMERVLLQPAKSLLQPAKKVRI